MVPYAEAWALQRRLASARSAGVIDDCVLLLEHPPVYTMGRNGRPEHVPGGPAWLRTLGAEYWDVDRGGSVTFHGPGQLVAYPIVLLAEAFPVDGSSGLGDVLRYLRALEEACIATASSAGVAAARRPPYTGAWVGARKLAAIGVKLAHGVTTHGLALNVTTDLSWFDQVVPCGISDAGVCSLSSCGVSGVDVAGLAQVTARHLAAALGRRLEPPDPALLEQLATSIVIASFGVTGAMLARADPIAANDSDVSHTV
jgi:lipoyl(octanoyl) transferase